MLTEVTEREWESYPEQGFWSSGSSWAMRNCRSGEQPSTRPSTAGRQRFSFAPAGAEDPQAGRPKREQEYYGQAFTQRNNPWQTNEKVRRLLLQPALGKYVTESGRNRRSPDLA